MSEQNLNIEQAILLYQQRTLSLGQAARLAGISRIDFQFLLASRQIPVNYDEKAFKEDLETIAKLRTNR